MHGLMHRQSTSKLVCTSAAELTLHCTFQALVCSGNLHVLTQWFLAVADAVKYACTAESPTIAAIANVYAGGSLYAMSEVRLRIVAIQRVIAVMHAAGSRVAPVPIAFIM